VGRGQLKLETDVGGANGAAEASKRRIYYLRLLIAYGVVILLGHVLLVASMTGMRHGGQMQCKL